MESEQLVRVWPSYFQILLYLQWCIQQSSIFFPNTYILCKQEFRDNACIFLLVSLMHVSKTNAFYVVKTYLFKTIDNFNQFRWIYFVRFTLHYLLFFLNISNTKRWIPAGNTRMQGLLSTYLISRSKTSFSFLVKTYLIIKSIISW